MLQYFGHLMQRADSLEKTLMLGKTEGRRRGQRSTEWLDSITDSMDTNLSKLQEIVEDRGAWRAVVPGAQEARHDLATEQQWQDRKEGVITSHSNRHTHLMTESHSLHVMRWALATAPHYWNSSHFRNSSLWRWCECSYWSLLSGTILPQGKTWLCQIRIDYSKIFTPTPHSTHTDNL